MAKGKGGQRVLRLKGVRRPVMTPPVEGPYPTFWRTEQLSSEDFNPGRGGRDISWDNLSWMVSPEGDVFLTRTITGGNPEHAAAGDVIARRLGYSTRPGDQWGGLGKSMEKGWSTIRWWVMPGSKSGGWLSIREAGEKNTQTLRRLKNMINNLTDLGLPLVGKPVDISLANASDVTGRGPRWAGTYDDLMSASNWRDLG
jgi:hypothetical protein